MQTSCVAFFFPCAQLPYRCQVLPTTSPSACFCQRERRGGKQSTHKAVPVCCIRHEGSGGAEEQRFNPALPLSAVLTAGSTLSYLPKQCATPNTPHTHTHTLTHASDNYDKAVCTYCLLWLIPVNSFFLQSVQLFRITHD